MWLREFSVDSFGPLAGLRIDELAPGLNIIYGPNGSGKTTVLRFLRGLWSGFGEARQLGLIPSLRDGQPGGSALLARAERRFCLTRIALPDRSDRLAVTVREGDVDDGAAVRAMLETAGPRLVSLLYAVGHEENHWIRELVATAASDGIQLAPVRKAHHLHDRIEAVQARRAALLEGEDVQQRTDRMRQECAAATAELETLRKQVSTIRENLANELPECHKACDQLQARVDWLHLECQSLQSDLIELAQQPHLPVRPAESPSHLPSDRLSELDLRIQHVRTVLEDLSRERTSRSLEIAELAASGREDCGILCQLHEQQVRWDRTEAELTSHVARLLAERQRLTEGCPRCSSKQEACPRCGRQHESPPVQTVPDTQRETSLRSALAERSEQWAHAREEWRTAFALRQEWMRQLEHVIQLEQRLAQREFEVRTKENRLSDFLREIESLDLLEAGIASLQEQVRVWEPAAVIQHASSVLRRLTDGRYPEIVIENESLQIQIRNEAGLLLSLHSLSRGTLDLVALAIRISLLDEYARRGLKFPMVLDDVLADCDDERLSAAARELVSVASRHQIIYFSCQERLLAAFEAIDVPVRNFPGTSRRPRAIPAQDYELEAAWARSPAPAPVVKVCSGESQAADTTPVGDEPPPRRRQPDQPYWLSSDSPLHLLPSLGEQMARRLGTIRLATIADLVAFDLEQSPIKLRDLQITAAQVRIWQAEARLLCCVPELTGRDVQILVGVGILHPQDLADADVDQLSRRIDRLRGDGRSGWASNGLVWPDRRAVLGWIEAGRRARTWQQALEAAANDRGFDSQKLSRRGGRRLRLDRGTPAAGRLRTHTGRRPRFSDVHAASRKLRPHVTPSGDAGESPEQAAGDEPSTDTAQSGQSTTGLRFFLNLDSPIVDAPSIGPTTARRLQKAGVSSVADFLYRDPGQLAAKVQHRRINAEIIRQWQQQARLMCRIPELRGHDAQVLVACGFDDPATIAAMSPHELFAIIGPFVATRDGQRMLRSSRSPDLAEVADWIRWAQSARDVRAA